MVPQRADAQRPEHVVGEPRQDGARGDDPAHHVLELALLRVRAARHPLDRALVLALQRTKLVQLLDHAALARRQRLPRVRHDAVGGRHGLVADDLLLGRHQQLDQRLLELRQPARLQQGVVGLHLGDEALLRRHREDARRLQIERGGRGLDLAPDLALDLVGRLQRVPQAVDLVEHGDVVAMTRVADDVPPDVEVAARDAGVGREHEQHRVRVRNERQRQLRLRPDRVQARRVEDHEPPLQQRMREVDDRVAPLRDLDHAARVDGDGLVGIVGIEQPVAARLLDVTRTVSATIWNASSIPSGELVSTGNTCHSWASRLKSDVDPARRARLDRQRADARRQRRVVQQFGRAHRRAPGGRRQHALAVLGEEDRVDQLGLAARELGDEGDDELVLGEAIEREVEAPPDVALEHLRLAHPLAQVDDRLRQRVAPVAVFLESGRQGSHGCGGSP